MYLSLEQMKAQHAGVFKLQLLIHMKYSLGHCDVWTIFGKQNCLDDIDFQNVHDSSLNRALWGFLWTITKPLKV